MKNGRCVNQSVQGSERLLEEKGLPENFWVWPETCNSGGSLGFSRVDPENPGLEREDPAENKVEVVTEEVFYWDT